jgi:hypothetical protein
MMLLLLLLLFAVSILSYPRHFHVAAGASNDGGDVHARAEKIRPND